MAFKLTYSDGQESTHDDDTKWELDDGVLKLGREEGKWSVLLSPHWAVLEFVASSDKDSDTSDDEDSGKETDKDSDRSDDDADDADDADDKKDKKKDDDED